MPKGACLICPSNAPWPCQVELWSDYTLPWLWDGWGGVCKYSRVLTWQALFWISMPRVIPKTQCCDHACRVGIVQCPGMAQWLSMQGTQWGFESSCSIGRHDACAVTMAQHGTSAQAHKLPLVRQKESINVEERCELKSIHILYVYIFAQKNKLVYMSLSLC